MFIPSYSWVFFNFIWKIVNYPRRTPSGPTLTVCLREASANRAIEVSWHQFYFKAKPLCNEYTSVLRVFNLYWKQLNLGLETETRIIFSNCAINRSLQTDVHGFVIWKRNSIHFRNRFKTTKYQKFCYLLSCTAPTLPFWGILHYIKHLPIVCWRFQKCPLSVLERRTSYREQSYSKRTEKRPTPGVHLGEVFILQRV